MKTEPLLTVSGITAFVAAVIALLVAFGLGLDNTQIAAIMGVVGVVAPVIVGLVARSKVTPVTPPDTDRRGPGEANLRANQ